MNSKSTGNIKGVASIFWTQDQQVMEDYMMKMSKSICSFGWLWDSCVDGSFGAYSLCKIPNDPLHCCGCRSVGRRNYGWCRHISREGRQFRLIVGYKDSASIHQDWKIAPPSVHTGLISFRIDWFDLLAVQGTLKKLLQHHSLKAPILPHSAFFMVQLSCPYMTTEKPLFWLYRNLLA